MKAARKSILQNVYKRSMEYVVINNQYNVMRIFIFDIKYRKMKNVNFPISFFVKKSL